METRRYLRHFILFGNIFAILRHRAAFKSLGHAIDKNLAESDDLAGNNFVDIDQIIEYGRIPSTAQKRTLDLIEDSYSPAIKGQRAGRRMMLGLHIDKLTGEPRERKFVSGLLIHTSSFLTGLVVLFLAGLGFDLIQAEGDTTLKVLAFLIILLTLTIPCAYYLYLSFAPYLAYQQTKRIADNHLP